MNDNTVIKAQKNALNVNDVDQYEAPSSRVNNIPPIGALNAAAIPEKINI